MKVYSAATPTEAHIVCELLKSHNIDCEVRGEGIFGLQGEVPFGDCSEPYIWLLTQSKKQQALDVIEQFNSLHKGENWFCQQCGECNEPQFGVCWQCGQNAH
ncbi:putative signal transducing protein [Vibrio sp. M260118]|uniref:putative signal transducing protein n=1 Tax=Vibrio sp. M260118 TaxID=3020896 RepID=UPI002F4106CA